MVVFVIVSPEAQFASWHSPPLTFSIGICLALPFSNDVQPEAEQALVAVRVPIKGMTCQSCVRGIEGSVSELSGVRHVKVASRYGVPVRQAEQALAVRVPIKGMTCQSSVRGIEGSVSELSGVRHVKQFDLSCERRNCIGFHASGNSVEGDTEAALRFCGRRVTLSLLLSLGRTAEPANPGAALGPLLAGVVSSGGAASWPRVFYMLIACNFMALFLLLRIVKGEIMKIRLERRLASPRVVRIE
ncbi:hypothetical protein MSG28_015517 [Choristoneura fumiferana]|uniref:Uncharacterized protein n=1 Tax=Choristoneura fumiferana TaxID=7141 RepID=A0ACC0KAH3_CHOFU|nr:hypothetical protein MSG28_015517 [Choristoneura fumiferana]